jgi:hypothetical protein
MNNVTIVIGAGLIGQAIARRVSVGKHVLLADMRRDNANAAAETLGNAVYEVSVAMVDASSRKDVSWPGRNGHGPRRGHETDPRGRRLPIAGVAFDDPQYPPGSRLVPGSRLHRQNSPWYLRTLGRTVLRVAPIGWLGHRSSCIGVPFPVSVRRSSP